MGKPLIGITTYVVPAKWSYWDLEAALVPAAYVQAVQRAGGRALLVPPADDAVGETLDGLDGLVFSGGRRDDAELALLTGALERDMPVLAICRGSQVLNVARGGDLVQHLPEVVGDEKHKHDPPGVFADHDVDLVPGTRIQSLLGDRAPVKSHHHQGFGRLGEGLHESARADDGTIEAVEDPAQRFAVGVLWHPEAGEDFALFQGLVDEARRYAEERR